jgi:hypothetical protein
MSATLELEGIDLNWFAMDSIGKIALFATAGAGFVPKSVVAGYAEHDAVSDGIETPNWGTERVWDDYAARGIFVYDWGTSGGPYRRVREPMAGVDEGLCSKVLSISSLPRLNVEFGNSGNISVSEVADAI